MEIITSWMEEGLEKGLDHERKAFLRQLRKRLGNLGPAVETQIEKLSADRLEQLAEALLDFGSVADLEAWLQDPTVGSPKRKSRKAARKRR